MHANEDVVIENTTSESEDEETPIRQVRLRRPLTRLNDYVIGRESKEENEMHNQAVFNTSQDPITYEDVVKQKVWRDAMNAKIESIKKNDTWELTALPTG
jgi:hypothetical protein